MARNSKFILTCPTLVFLFSTWWCLLQWLAYNPTKENHQHTTTQEVCYKYIIALSIASRYTFNLIILKMCCFNSLRCILISWHGWIIVHLQTLLAVPPNLFVLLFPAALAALAAPAAVFATAAKNLGHHLVPRRHGVQGPWQKVPVTEELWQVAGAARLHHVDNDHKDDQHNDGHADADQDLPASQRQAEYRQR